MTKETDDAAATSYECTGPNPDYRPPVMRWNKVEILSPEGMEFGVVYDNDGLLSVAVRHAGDEWPSGSSPSAESINVILPGHKAYAIENLDTEPTPHADLAARLAKYDDVRPLTPEVVMELLPKTDDYEDYIAGRYGMVAWRYWGYGRFSLEVGYAGQRLTEWTIGAFRHLLAALGLGDGKDGA